MARERLLKGPTFGKEGRKEPAGYSMDAQVAACSKQKSRTAFRTLWFVNGRLKVTVGHSQVQGHLLT